MIFLIEIAIAIGIVIDSLLSIMDLFRYRFRSRFRFRYIAPDDWGDINLV